MKVMDYIDKFMKDHKMRYSPHDWPEIGSEEWMQYRRLWISALIDKKVKPNEADTASVRCGPNPPRFRSDHIPRILAEIEAVRLANQINNVPDDRAIAAAQSVGCEHCDGTGWRTVYHPRYDGTATVRLKVHGKETIQSSSPQATCSCSLGQFNRAGLEPADRARYPEVQKILNGQSRWQYSDPTEEIGDEKPTTMAELMSHLDRVAKPVGDRPNPRNAKRERENWYVRFLVNALEAGPLPFQSVAKRASDAGHDDANELRTAAELARIKIVHQDGQELWGLE